MSPLWKHEIQLFIINYFGIFQSLKLRILVEKILPISLKLNFTPNTLGCYVLKMNGESEVTKVSVGIRSISPPLTSVIWFL